jgi:hypothetical protein
MVMLRVKMIVSILVIFMSRVYNSSAPAARRGLEGNS